VAMDRSDSPSGYDSERGMTSESSPAGRDEE
jgi:hypothetical protein